MESKAAAMEGRSAEPCDVRRRWPESRWNSDTLSASSSARAAGEMATLLLMPAWHGAQAGQGFIGIKIATVFPENAKRNAPSVNASYLLLDGTTGAPLAIMDGRAITLWRTAAASALAA